MTKLRTFSPEQKRELHRMLHEPVKMADGSDVPFGVYVGGRLQDVIDQDEEFAKEKMMAGLKLLAWSMKQHGKQGKVDARQIERLRWEDGSIEGYFHDMDTVYKVVDEIPDAYLHADFSLPQSTHLMNSRTALRQRFQDVILAQQYRSAIEQLLEAAQAIQEGRPVDLNEENFLLSKKYFSAVSLEVMLRSPDPRDEFDDALDADILGELPPEYHILEQDFHVNDKDRPVDAKAFDKQFKKFAAYIKTLVTQPEQETELGGRK